MLKRKPTRRKRRSSDAAPGIAASNEHLLAESVTPELEPARLRELAAPASRETPPLRGATLLQMQRTLGNAQVASLLAQRRGTHNVAQRYPVEVAPDASCDQVIDWINQNSPYAPEWAHTQADPAWSGSFRITGNATSGFRVRMVNPRVTMTTSVDMPEWQPDDRAMRTAWDSAYRDLRAHERQHERIAANWRQQLARRLQTLNLPLPNATTREEAEAQAGGVINEQWDIWVNEHQKAQDAIDPYEVIVNCPTPEAEE